MMSEFRAERKSFTSNLVSKRSMHIGLASIMVGLVYVMYHGYGIALEPAPSGLRPTSFIWMLDRWKTGVLSYGAVYYILRFVVPTATLTILWMRRFRIARAVSTPNRLGLLVIVVALMANWVGVKTEHPRLSLLSLIALLWGVPFYLYGWKLAREIWFPVALLVFCVPLNFLDAPMFKVRILAARASASIINGLGMECVPRATGLAFPEGGGMLINMQAASTALGNFILFMAGTAILAYFSRLPVTRKFVLFAGTLPAYAVASCLVLTLQGLVGLSLGPEAAVPDAAWMTPLTLTLSTLVWFGWYRILQTNLRQSLHLWLQRRQQAYSPV